MAEGWANALKKEVINAYSAGVEIHGLNPVAVKVMAEAGVDISGHRSKQVSELDGIHWDVVITLCGHAHETCPYFPGPARVIHKGFDDPPEMADALAEQGEDEEAQLACYRRVRDEIRRFVEDMPENIADASG